MPLQTSMVKAPPISAFWIWCIAWIAISGIILVGIMYFDQWLALSVRDRVEPSRIAYLLIQVPEAIAAVTIFGTLVLGAWHALLQRLQGKWYDVLLACLAICIALAVKTELKLLFGRVSPETWFQHQSQPFRSFHMMHAGSFPSGHMVVLGVLASFIWSSGAAPRLFWFLLCLSVGTALIIAQAHYVTDLVAGLLLGATIGSGCRTMRSKI